MPIGNNYSGIGPERGVEFIFYMGLVSQANTKTLQSNPTIAAGDFKVSIDGGSFENLDTLPAVTPASSKSVKVTLAGVEMEGDNITMLASDASGAEWCDRMISIQTTSGAAQAMELAAVTNASFAPTATEFESSDITEATADHYLGRAVLFRTGTLKNQAAVIMVYALSGGKAHFIVTPLTEAPGNGDKFVII